jgi:hypothetical protein
MNRIKARTLHSPFLKQYSPSISNMSFPIPTGSYVVMNATTRTYLNLLTFDPVPGAIVCSVGNHQGNDIVRLPHTCRGTFD